MKLDPLYGPRNVYTAVNNFQLIRLKQTCLLPPVSASWKHNTTGSDRVGARGGGGGVTGMLCCLF